MDTLCSFRTSIRQLHLADDSEVLRGLIADYSCTDDELARIHGTAIDMVVDIRENGSPGLMESFLAQYGLSTDEGVALMCLAEALLRVPDAQTIDELIEDKIAPSSWGKHLGASSSSLVNASTWALMLSGKVLRENDQSGIADVLHDLVKRVGEPLIRAAVTQAMKEMGHQFVLGRTISEAINRGESARKKGYTFSYDMLGEAALTAQDATAFFESYRNAIQALEEQCLSDDVRSNPGISIKLSALHPRYELLQKDRVINEMVPRVEALAILAKNAGMGFNIDAEEADRLDLSLDIIEQVLRSPKLQGWNGFGVVVQAYSKRAGAVIDWLYSLAVELDRKIMVRLVKGAYWDTEIKRAQVDGLKGFPVFTRKSATDAAYICCARKLLKLSPRIYAQFATHNAHTVAAILEIAQDATAFEFQRLHGMGESLYDNVMRDNAVRCRIYAPVGAHRDLLAYLVRRLLENGANSSFVNQIVDQTVSPEHIAEDVFAKYNAQLSKPSTIPKPAELYQPERINSVGCDLYSVDELIAYDHARAEYAEHQWHVKPAIADSKDITGNPVAVRNPANPDDCVGYVTHATEQDVEFALGHASNWNFCTGSERAKILNNAADLYEQHAGEFYAVLCREAGKSAQDVIAEIREAVDFLRYYAARAKEVREEAMGIVTCISPWNFPLAIFTGQISAALAAGNGVLAKPADPTPIVASIGIRLLHQAGVPREVLQLLPGRGSVVGAKITSDPRVNGICFTGSTMVAQTINKAMSGGMDPSATFIAETGGLNAMIIDSTALPEQAITDILVSAFQSAGQRCSALRLLYLQTDIAEEFLPRLYGAMDELSIGSPWLFDTDIGPVISATAKQEIEAYTAQAAAEGRLLKSLPAPKDACFVDPAVIQVDGIKDLYKEVFGPVLHVAVFEAENIDKVLEEINDSGYGLTFGLHTRIDDKVEKIISRLNVGNIYVNRNQIGAIVGSQPFGGEGLSGTGPKAGGPRYVNHFLRKSLPLHKVESDELVPMQDVQQLLNNVRQPTRTPLTTHDLPGPTGESNRLSTFSRGVVLCLGPTVADVSAQIELAANMGCPCISVAPGISGSGMISGFLDRASLTALSGFSAVALWSDQTDLSAARIALSMREGPILPLMSHVNMQDMCVVERHVCINTTAAGGNTALLSQ